MPVPESVPTPMTQNTFLTLLITPSPMITTTPVPFPHSLNRPAPHPWSPQNPEPCLQSFVQTSLTLPPNLSTPRCPNPWNLSLFPPISLPPPLTTLSLITLNLNPSFPNL